MSSSCVAARFSKNIQNLNAFGLTYLRMEQRREQIVLPHGGDEGTMVIRRERNDAFFARYAVIGVDEVEMRPLSRVGEHRRPSDDPASVPAHMRHFVLGRHL